MKTKEIKALHTKDIGELIKEQQHKRQELAKLVSSRLVKPGKNSRIFSTLKDDIARISTVLAEKAKETHKK